MNKKIIAVLLFLGIVPALLSGCGTTTYSGDKLLKLPSGRPVENRAYYESLLLKKSMLAKDKTRLEESLINRPNTPIYIHSKILRMLVMPYVDTNSRLHTYQYIYFKIKKGGWLLGNYLMQTHKSKVFNPLAHVSNKQAKQVNITTYSQSKHKQVKNYSKPKGGDSVMQRDFAAMKKENGQ